MTEFHGTKEWIALASFHKLTERYNKNYICVDCGTSKHLESDHVAPVRYKLFRLCMFNLVLRCGTEANGCNNKKSDKLYWRHWQTWLIVGIYAMIKLFCFGFGIVVGLFVVITVGQYIYYDADNGGTIAGTVADNYVEAAKWAVGL